MASKREAVLWINPAKFNAILTGELESKNPVGTLSSEQGLATIFLQTRLEDGKPCVTEKKELVLQIKKSLQDQDEGDNGRVMTVFFDLKKFAGIRNKTVPHTQPVGYAYYEGEEGNSRNLFVMCHGDGTPVLSNVEGKSRKFGFNLRARKEQVAQVAGM